MIIFNGIRNLLASKKATFSLILVFLSAWLCYQGKIPGTVFAGIVTAAVTVYQYVSHKIDLARGKDQP